MEEQVVEQQGVAGTERRSYDRRVDRELLDDGGTDRPVEDRAARPRLDDVVEPPREQVDARRVDAAVRERDPDVQGADPAAEEGAVLVPVGVRGDRHLAERALVRRQDRALAEVLGDDVADPEVVVRLEQQVEQVRRVAGEHATRARDPVAAE